MSRPVSFTKMTAYGNDYVYLIDLERKLKRREEAARMISERNFSVGSDGLIVVERSENADFFMRVYNPDGTEAEMCGNGLRSVGMLVYEKRLIDRTAFSIETLGGVKRIYLETDGSHVRNITANIGRPVLDTALIPIVWHDDRLIETPLEIADRRFICTALSLGNPHLVLFCDEPESIDLAVYGRAAEHCSRFPQRTNAEFCSFPARDTIRLRTWERGTGETQACATGCCACTVAGVLADLCERQVSVIQNGGTTEVEWSDNGDLYMTAPSQIVFEGKIMLPDSFFEDAPLQGERV